MPEIGSLKAGIVYKKLDEPIMMQTVQQIMSKVANHVIFHRASISFAGSEMDVDPSENDSIIDVLKQSRDVCYGNKLNGVVLYCDRND